jgi:hypothetical protein
MPLITQAQANLMQLPNPSLQTVEVPKTFSLNEAKNWLKQHGFLYQNYRSTKNFRRFIQAYDVKNAQFYSKKLPNNIVLVFQQW